MSSAEESKRISERIEILGELVGEVMIFQPISIKEISRGGAQVETGFPLQLDSLHDFRLTLGDRSVVVKGRVVHCSITDVEQELVLYRPGIEYNPGAVWFLDRSKAGGGTLYDWGVYDLDLLFGIFGPLDVAEVMALTFRGVDRPRLETPYDVEEHAAAMLKLRDGRSIFWERAWATHLPPENRWDFYGTLAGASFVPHNEVYRVDLNLRLTRYAPGPPVELPTPPLAPPGPDAYEDFLLAVAGERPPAVSGREAAAMLRIIEAVYASAELGRAVPISAPVSPVA